MASTSVICLVPRVDPSFALAMHIDTDEANAAHDSVPVRADAC